MFQKFVNKYSFRNYILKTFRAKKSRRKGYINRWEMAQFSPINGKTFAGKGVPDTND